MGYLTTMVVILQARRRGFPVMNQYGHRMMQPSVSGSAPSHVRRRVVLVFRARPGGPELRTTRDIPDEYRGPDEPLCEEVVAMLYARMEDAEVISCAVEPRW